MGCASSISPNPNNNNNQVPHTDRQKSREQKLSSIVISPSPNASPNDDSNNIIHIHTCTQHTNRLNIFSSLHVSIIVLSRNCLLSNENFF